ncbi:Protein of unknown function [Micromonospora yangpuensis]|uniref:Uncharacterized protein n=1 Tax=Micromonospora yangpuensis TaxID=683228 RepID=A0A1C6U8H4_9ACTN|nr:Protein of unknown function [Micromonospora yangpuensis]
MIKSETLLVSLVFLAALAVLLAVLVVVMRPPTPVAVRRFSPVCSSDHSSDLERSLDEALAATRYQAGRGGSPGVHLGEVLRLKPVNFRESLPQVAEAIRAGRVVSLDLSLVGSYDAMCLVIYCHGLCSGLGSWIYRLAEEVIVICPVNEERSGLGRRG